MIVLELCIIVASACLCIILLRSDIHATLPAFSRYVFFQTFASIASLSIYSIGGRTYFVTYYVLILFGCILAAVAAGELAIQLLGPSGALPDWVHKRRTLMAGTGIAAALAAAFPLWASHGETHVRACILAEQWMAGALWVTFTLIFIFWRTLKVFRRQTRAALICFGFVLYFTVCSITVFFRGRGGLEAAIAARYAGMGSYLLTLLVWTGALLMKAPVFKKATPEKVEIVMKDFEDEKEAVITAAAAQ
ncbi:MAG TPA: hypothetical protein VGK24_05870 [Candidatus Angelobacter sp.]|jgi:hypothetical protein